MRSDISLDEEEWSWCGDWWWWWWPVVEVFADVVAAGRDGRHVRPLRRAVLQAGRAAAATRLLVIRIVSISRQVRAQRVVGERHVTRRRRLLTGRRAGHVLRSTIVRHRIDVRWRRAEASSWYLTGSVAMDTDICISNHNTAIGNTRLLATPGSCRAARSRRRLVPPSGELDQIYRIWNQFVPMTDYVKRDVVVVHKTGST